MHLHETAGFESSLHLKVAGRVELKKTCTSFPVICCRAAIVNSCDSIHEIYQNAYIKMPQSNSKTKHLLYSLKL